MKEGREEGALVGVGLTIMGTGVNAERLQQGRTSVAIATAGISSPSGWPREPARENHQK